MVTKRRSQNWIPKNCQKIAPRDRRLFTLFTTNRRFGRIIGIRVWVVARLAQWFFAKLDQFVSLYRVLNHFQTYVYISYTYQIHLVSIHWYVLAEIPRTREESGSEFYEVLGHFMPWMSIENVEVEKKMQKIPKKLKETVGSFYRPWYVKIHHSSSRNHHVVQLFLGTVYEYLVLSKYKQRVDFLWFSSPMSWVMLEPRYLLQWANLPLQRDEFFANRFASPPKLETKPFNLYTGLTKSLP